MTLMEAVLAKKKRKVAQSDFINNPSSQHPVTEVTVAERNRYDKRTKLLRMPHKPAVIELHPGSVDGVRVLLADDFAPWRSYLRSFLKFETEWMIVFEACNGLEAVQKTVELRPDVVLRDISMPCLNGIEAARRIRQLSPESKIIILTQNADNDWIAAALEAGALAYVLKAEMITKLIPAIQEALRVRS